MQELMLWYERYVSPVALVTGFLADNYILLKRVDLLQTNLLLIFYLVVAALGIIVIHFVESGRMRDRRVVKALPLVLIAMQFAFGGLFSGYLSLYGRSAALPLNWIFVFILAALVLGNERFMRLYSRFLFQIGLYFTVLFSFLIFFLPIVTHRIGPLMFMLSGALSLFMISLFLWILRRFVPEVVDTNLRRTTAIIVVIYSLFNILYFLNLIPPLPLALKDAGVYHGVVRTQAGQYELSGEPVRWYEPFLRYNTIYHAASGEGVYVFSSIFAPAGLSTVILHEWQKYDDISQQWISAGTVRFPIVGGRDGGYRGYSFKSSLLPGKWRVNVITEYGQLIGRIAFEIVPTTDPVSLVSVAK
ncbi:DUF2914 domain-containing protein [Candidatus Kaiserbacteria bacterium]|nr:DUF2914 domain-containing protein [Candidatus Kaiserbacteria bacterium]